ncbi:MAG: sigma 54-interacting transcriptional regulator, partial [Bacteroidales bacterium]|nr:sigma 54-interacting transcriptional regulator [Bacteroidales bacterium]
MSPSRSISIITQNEGMRAIIAKLQKVVHTDSSILLIGETGVGKEIFAEYIHRSSNRNQNTFVKIGLASLPSDLMASELFGYEKGAFTSANGTKKGLFEMADQGSIFLDDIDDVPLDIQAKLL